MYKINNKTGIHQITTGKSVMRWNREYWTGDYFISTTHSKDKLEEPRQFQIIPSLKENITCCIGDHQDEMSVDAVYKAVHVFYRICTINIGKNNWWSFVNVIPFKKFYNSVA